MAESHIISALSKKRSELLGSIGHYKELVHKFDSELATIDATIRIFEPDFKFSSIKAVNIHKRNRYFETGEAKMLILDSLREENRDIRTDDLADIIMKKKNLAFEDEYDIKNFKKSILHVLGALEKSNLVQRVKKEGLVIIWKIKELN